MKTKVIIMNGASILFTILSLVGCSKDEFKAELNPKMDAIMNADRGFKFPPGFPPDPGEAGKKTLEGIDTDGDGVRDDLQRWIYARYPNDAKKQSALKQLVRHYHRSLFLEHSKEDMRAKLRSAKNSRVQGRLWVFRSPVY